MMLVYNHFPLTRNDDVVFFFNKTYSIRKIAKFVKNIFHDYR